MTSTSKQFIVFLPLSKIETDHSCQFKKGCVKIGLLMFVFRVKQQFITKGRSHL